MKCDRVTNLPRRYAGVQSQRWNHSPPLGKVTVDPECGRIMFNKDEKIIDVHVYYYYGFSSEIGGGFYDRELSKLDEEVVEALIINTQATIHITIR